MAASPQFDVYFHVFGLSVTWLVSCCVLVQFGERMFAQRFRFLPNLAGFLAALCGVTSTSYVLSNLFFGIHEYLTCASLLLLGHTLLSLSNLLSFLHLFLRSHRVNCRRRLWRRWCFFGVVIMLANTIAASCTTLSTSYAVSADGNLCEFTFDHVALNTQLLLEIANHIFQILALSVPLLRRIAIMNRTAVGTISSNLTSSVNVPCVSADHQRQVHRSLIVSSLAVVFSVQIIVLTFQTQSTTSFHIPWQGLRVLNTCVILVSIYYAETSSSLFSTSSSFSNDDVDTASTFPRSNKIEQQWGVVTASKAQSGAPAGAPRRVPRILTGSAANYVRTALQQ